MQALIDFLNARLDETEMWANRCAEVYPTPWYVSERGHCATVKANEPGFSVVAGVDQSQATPGCWPGEHLEHIVNHDPARVLADVKAKRRIVDAHRSGFPDEDRYAVGWHDMRVNALYWLAAVYADHPDYDPNWRI